MRPPTHAHPMNAHAKALALNLDPSIYGTFAEIGAGQETARWFLRVGAASGTVAQTISAYDKTFSDQTYGAGTRYVSRERLLSMLDHEYRLLLERLASTRGGDTRFFVFANTVATRNFKGDNDQHGWMGIRFQNTPGAPPSDLLLHVNLMDPAAQLQQEAVGTFGVNLVYAAFNQRGNIETFLSGLKDGVPRQRLELDVIDLRGEAFEGIDSRLCCLRALERGMCHALVFDSEARLVEPASVLRKRAMIVERGRFTTVEPFQADMLARSLEKLRSEGMPIEREPACVLETTIHHAAEADVPPPAVEEILSRVQRVAPMGSAVIVSDFGETYHLIDFLRRHTEEPVRVVIGISALVQMLNAQFYTNLPGALLEGLAKFLATNVKAYAYPMPTVQFRKIITGPKADVYFADLPPETVTVDDIHPPPPLNHLYRYLREAGWVVGL